MPITIKPKKYERQDMFTKRCIETLYDTEGNRFTNNQRQAICYVIWKKNNSR